MGIIPAERQIVRRWTDHQSPTGEGECYQTKDGSVWKQTLPRVYAQETGDVRGNVQYDKMVER